MRFVVIATTSSVKRDVIYKIGSVGLDWLGFNDGGILESKPI